jgi:SAM-dependent methyltransferase
MLQGEVRAVADAEILPLQQATHDLLVHAIALHWSNDPVGQLVQMRHALRPDGLMIAALFGGDTLAELRVALAEAEIEILGGLSPRVAPMGALRDLGGLLQRAGFALPVADSARYDVRYPSVLALMRDLRGMAETNVMVERLRRPMRRELLGRAAAIYAERFGTADGRVSATFEVIFLTGWAPSADQPKPMRPGSARMSLAEALGTVERGAGEKAGRGGPVSD